MNQAQSSPVKDKSEEPTFNIQTKKRNEAEGAFFTILNKKPKDRKQLFKRKKDDEP